MSTTQLAVFDGLQLPANLMGELYGNASALLGGLGGQGVNKLSIRQSVFRLQKGGQELIIEQPTIDVVIIAASPHVGRKYYKNGYVADSKDAPTCFSQDGVSPANKSEEKQSPKCATCPQNQLGSGKPIGNKQTRACSFNKRIVIVAHGEEDGDAYAYDANALSIFGEGRKDLQKFTLSEYGKILGTARPGYPQGIPPIVMVTRISFDREASVPKVFFTPAGYLSPDAITKALARSKEPDVLAMLEDISAGQEPDEPLTPEAIAAKAVSVPAIVAPTPPVQPVVTAPPPPPEPPAQPAAAPKVSGFGVAKPATPAAAPAQPAAVIPQVNPAPAATAMPAGNAKSIAEQLANFDD